VSRHRRKASLGDRVFNTVFLASLVIIGAGFAYVLRLIFVIVFQVPPPH
jgi:hypothetical protein